MGILYGAVTLIIVMLTIHLQAADERHEAELHQKNEEIRQKNTRLEQVQVRLEDFDTLFLTLC